MASDIVCIGFDAGLTNLGVGVISPSGEYADSFVLRTENETGTWNKGINLYWQLEKIFAEWNKEHGETIRLAVESPSFGSHFNAQNVAFSRGIICAFAAEYSIPVIDAPPAAVKKLVAGNGRANKKELRQAVCDYLNMPTLADMTFDESDAIAVALWQHITAINPDLKPKPKRKQPKQIQEHLPADTEPVFSN